MKVIRFEVDERVRLVQPPVREIPGLEGWVEIRGLDDYKVEGIKGTVVNNRFLQANVEKDVIITVDGVKFKISKELLNPVTPDAEEIEYISPVISESTGSNVDVDVVVEKVIESLSGVELNGGNLGE